MQTQGRCCHMGLEREWALPQFVMDAISLFKPVLFLAQLTTASPNHSAASIQI